MSAQVQVFGIDIFRPEQVKQAEPKQIKRTHEDLLYEVATQILAGMRNTSIKLLVRLSGTALKQCLGELFGQNFVERVGTTSYRLTASGLLWHAWQKASRTLVEINTTSLDESRLNAFRQKIAEKLAWLRRSPNQKAADRNNRPNAKLNRKIMQADCPLCELGRPHVQHFKRLNTQGLLVWLNEGQEIIYRRLKIKKLSNQIAKDLATIADLKARKKHTQGYNERRAIDENIAYIYESIAPTRREIGQLESEIQDFELEVTLLELQVNGFANEVSAT